MSVGWDEALDDLAAVVATSSAAHGPDAVALYLATGLAYDAAGQIATVQWHRAIGSRAFYTATTVDNAPVLVAAQLVTGTPELNPVWDPSRPGLLLVVGSNPVISHGYGTTLPDPVQHLRGYRQAGGSVWVLDPRETETAANADEHLAVRPGSDIAVLAAVAAAVLADGADRGELAQFCDAGDVEALERALAPFTVERRRGGRGAPSRADRSADRRDPRPSRPAGDALWHGRHDESRRSRRRMVALGAPHPHRFARSGRWNALPRRDLRTSARGPGRTTRPRPGPASRPELPRVAGQVPAVALADEIDAGNVRVLVVAGGNPLTALPEPDRLRATLSRLDALVMVDVVESELTSLATHVLPATGQLERFDVTLTSQLSVRSAVQSTDAVVTAGGRRRPAWWIFASLAERAGVGLVGEAGPDALDDRAFLERLLAASPLGADAILDAGSHGLPIPVEVGWVRGLLPDGKWRIAPPVLLERLLGSVAPAEHLVLVPRRDGVWNNSIRYGRKGEERIVRLHPIDAEAAGVHGGDEADVSSVHGELTAVVAIDPSLRPGVVSIGHGRAGRSPGQLTSQTDAVDPLTAMPHASGVAIRIRPTAADR